MKKETIWLLLSMLFAIGCAGVVVWLGAEIFINSVRAICGCK